MQFKTAWLHGFSEMYVIYAQRECAMIINFFFLFFFCLISAEQCSEFVQYYNNLFKAE